MNSSKAAFLAYVILCVSVAANCYAEESYMRITLTSGGVLQGWYNSELGVLRMDGGSMTIPGSRIAKREVATPPVDRPKPTVAAKEPKEDDINHKISKNRTPLNESPPQDNTRQVSSNFEKPIDMAVFALEFEALCLLAPKDTPNAPRSGDRVADIPPNATPLSISSQVLVGRWQARVMGASTTVSITMDGNRVRVETSERDVTHYDVGKPIGFRITDTGCAREWVCGLGSPYQYPNGEAVIFGGIINTQNPVFDVATGKNVPETSHRKPGRLIMTRLKD